MDPGLSGAAARPLASLATSRDGMDPGLSGAAARPLAGPGL